MGDGRYYEFGDDEIARVVSAMYAAETLLRDILAAGLVSGWGDGAFEDRTRNVLATIDGCRRDGIGLA